MNTKSGGSKSEWINSWYKDLFNGKNNNSYKMALAFALVDLITRQKTQATKNHQAPIRDVAAYFAQVYWNHTSVYKLRESASPQQRPRTVQWIEDYLKNHPNLKGVKWAKLSQDDQKAVEAIFVKKNRSILRNPLSRFQHDHKNLHAGGDLKGSGWLYQWDIDKDVLIINRGPFNDILHNARLYKSIAVLSWAQFLEKYNATVNLTAKLQPDTVKRRLSKFHSIMAEDDRFEYHRCFYCRQKIAKDESVHLDHVIPFSFLLSDDLFNLVPSCKTCNRDKSDKLVIDSKALIRLKKRNREIFTDYKTDLPFEAVEAMDKRFDELLTLARANGFDDWER